jgi:hypothetical protein
MIIYNARCTREIISRIVVAKAAFNRKKTPFNSKLDLNLRLHLEHSILLCWNWGTLESILAILGKV